MTQTTGLCIYVLGPMRIERDDVRIRLPRRKVESLLAFLLLHPEQHTREELAALFWGDSTDAQARHSLRTALATVRQAIDPSLLNTDRDHVQLNRDFPLWIDLHQLLSLENEPEYTNRNFLHENLALWQGELLAGLFDEWITAEREYYRTRLLKMLLHIIQTLRARSEYEQAIEVAQRVFAFDAANEEAHQHLMFCYLASGDRAAALRQYEQCVRALQEELDAPPMPETTALYEWIRQHEGGETSPAAKITNLPIPLSSFIGRTRETTELKRLFGLSHVQGTHHAVRLLTLTGPGGSGKTRLAIHVATDLIDSFAHGVWWVELAALVESDLVVSAVAKALGVQEVPNQPLSETLASFIGEKRLLLVLDNCEHLIEACAQLATTLLTRCPNLQILTTSREPLNITGETLWTTPALAAPTSAQLTLVDLWLQFEAVQLFVERAMAVNPVFALTPENAPAVVDICQRLDGIPLALELAAARVKVLAVEQIAGYLAGAIGSRFNLLTQGSRAAMPRHQTLRATIDWSYNLLDAPERLLFRQVAIFRDGFTLDALVELIGSPSKDSPSSSPTTLELLSLLVDKSLIVAEQQGGQTRFRLLETLREYALEQFPDTGELTALQEKHAEVFLRLADQAALALVRAQQHEWLNRLEVEHANLSGALDFLIAQPDGERALRLATALQRFWEIRGFVREGREWLEKSLLLRASAPASIVAHALNATGRLATRQGELEQARLYYDEALLLFEQSGDEIGVADTMLYLVTHDMAQGHYANAPQRFNAILDHYRARNHEPGIASVLSRLGTLAWDQDRFEDARAFHRESYQIYRRLGIPLRYAYETLVVGDAERMLDNLDAARLNYEECLQIAQSLRHKGLVAASLKSLGLLATRQGDLDQARRYTQEALTTFRELGDKVQIGFAHSSLGDVARKLGEYSQALLHYKQYLRNMYEADYKWPTLYALEDIAYLLIEVEQHVHEAVHLLGAAEQVREAIGIDFTPKQQANHDRIVTALRQQFTSADFDARWQAGRAAPLAQSVAEVAQISLT